MPPTTPPQSSSGLDALRRARKIISDNAIPIATINGGYHRLDLRMDEYQVLVAALSPQAQAGEQYPEWTVRKSDAAIDDDYPPENYFDVLCPDGKWRGCVAVSVDDARDCIQKQWAEEQPSLPPQPVSVAQAARETCIDCGKIDPCDDDCPNFIDPSPPAALPAGEIQQRLIAAGCCTPDGTVVYASTREVLQALSIPSTDREGK